MSRPSKALFISVDDKSKLQMMSNSGKDEHRYVSRARIILALSSGKQLLEICDELDVGKTAVAKWKGRFLRFGIEGIKDKEGRGRKHTYGPDVRARIVQMACSNPEGGYTNWSLERIANEVGVSKTTVYKTLKEHNLKTHK